jgi:hypothetical protein
MEMDWESPYSIYPGLVFDVHLIWIIDLVSVHLIQLFGLINIDLVFA